jgi:hypothetical protein
MEQNLNQMHPFTAMEQKLAQHTNPIKLTVVEIYILLLPDKKSDSVVEVSKIQIPYTTKKSHYVLKFTFISLWQNDGN